MASEVQSGFDRLDRLLRPRSVAIVGASPTPSALGNSVLRNLQRLGFAGSIHLVNPRRSEIDGLPCVPRVDDLPEGVDVAVLAIPGPAVLETLHALARIKAGAAIIFSAGFAEGGADGMAAQAEMARIARETGMVIEGPNCLGMVNFIAGVSLTFVEIPPVPRRPGRSIALVSQSGAMAIVETTTLLAKGLGLSCFVSTGNEAASGVEDYVERLIADDDTQIIGMIVEQFRQPARFLALAERARAAGKPIVLLHPGRSASARESAATHTGAMAGDWSLMQAKVSAAGVVVVEDLEELGDVLDLAARCPQLESDACAVLTESGAFKGLTLDLCERIGLPLPPPGAEVQQRLRADLPDFIGISNPMDLTAQALVDPGLYGRTLEALLADPAYGCILFTIIQTDAATCDRKYPAIIEAIERLAPATPVLVAGMDEGADVPQPYLARLRALGVPWFPTADRALRAVRRLGSSAWRAAPVAPALPPVGLGPLAGGTWPEYQAKQLLAAAGIPFPAGGFAASLPDAQAVAASVGYPVALKAQAAALPHKSDAGGVLLQISDPAALAAAWARIHANVKAHAPGVVLDGVLVERMGRRGIEMIVGGRNDPDWGPVVLVGFGGVQAEIHKDVCLLPADASHAMIIDGLRNLKAAPLLSGFRGAPPADVAALADLVARVGAVLRGTPDITELDLNPVVVFPAGEGCVALDALIQA